MLTLDAETTTATPGRGFTLWPRSEGNGAEVVASPGAFGRLLTMTQRATILGAGTGLAASIAGRRR